MELNKIITSTKGDKEGRIDDLIDFLVSEKQKGATNYQMRWSNDPMWAFKWFETFRIQSDEESNAEAIKKLESKINNLKQKI